MSTSVQYSNEFPLLTKGNEPTRCEDAADETQHRKIVLRAGVGNVERAMLPYPAKLLAHQY